MVKKRWLVSVFNGYSVRSPTGLLYCSALGIESKKNQVHAVDTSSMSPKGFHISFAELMAHSSNIRCRRISGQFATIIFIIRSQSSYFSDIHTPVNPWILLYSLPPPKISIPNKRCIFTIISVYVPTCFQISRAFSKKEKKKCINIHSRPISERYVHITIVV